MKIVPTSLWLIPLLYFCCTTMPAQVQSPPLVVDAHQDILLRILDKGHSFGTDYPGIQGGIPKWKAGGNNAIFFSVWLDPRKYSGAAAIVRAHRLIDAFEAQCTQFAAAMEPCDTAVEVRAATSQGKIAALLGLEGGIAINNDISQLQRYRNRGVRYMTLTWRGNLSWAGSSQSDNPSRGLDAFGRQVIGEMNRLGIIVDLSHVSDATFNDALEVTTRPVIVSHSNSRLLSPHPRNVTDEMLRKLAQNGGVIGINFVGDFLRQNTSGTGWERRPGRPDIENVLDQIDHVRNVAGIDHIGIGTDFDGGIRPAIGLEDASKFPALWEGLARRGYSQHEINKVAGQNFLRVLEANDTPVAQPTGNPY